MRDPEKTIGGMRRENRRVSLSVQKANYALRMYRKAGFSVVADHGDELLMVCRLNPAKRTGRIAKFA